MKAQIREGRDGWYYKIEGDLGWIGPFPSYEACYRAILLTEKLNKQERKSWRLYR